MFAHVVEVGEHLRVVPILVFELGQWIAHQIVGRLGFHSLQFFGDLALELFAIAQGVLDLLFDFAAPFFQLFLFRRR